ncbi:MAG: FAD-dependent oxidoreductase [Pseudomonadota bacterium]
MNRPQVIVVGAGIMGAWTAHALAKAGASVTVIDATGAPGRGVSAESFGWINSLHALPGTEEHARRQSGLKLWRRWAKSRPDLACVDMCGALFWAESPGASQALAKARAAAGEPVQIVEGDALSRYAPGLTGPFGPQLAMFSAHDLAVDLPLACAALIDEARAAGAELRSQVSSHALLSEDDRVCGVDTSAGQLRADAVVLATGAAFSLSPHLAGGSDAPRAAVSPAIIVRASLTRPHRLAHAILQGPGIEIRQPADLTLLLARNVQSGMTEAEHATAAADAIGAHFPQAGGLATIWAREVARPLTPSWVPPEGVHLAIAHPGAILAPLVAEEIVARILPSDAADRP